MDWFRARVASLSGILAITLMATFGIVLMVLHVLAAEAGTVPYYLSHFQLLENSWLWVTGLGLFAASAFALALSLTIALPSGGWSKFTLANVWAIGPLAIMVAVFPPAAPGAITTWVGRVHEVAAIAMFLLMGVAMLSLFPALRWGWGVMAWTSLILGATFFALTPWMITGFINGTPDVAYSERIVVSIQGLWLMTVGVWARNETAPFTLRRPVGTPTTTQAPVSA
jgi:hypothetical protein